MNEKDDHITHLDIISEPEKTRVLELIKSTSIDPISEKSAFLVHWTEACQPIQTIRRPIREVSKFHLATSCARRTQFLSDVNLIGYDFPRK
jgi:hypothetical protein